MTPATLDHESPEVRREVLRLTTDERNRLFLEHWPHVVRIASRWVDDEDCYGSIALALLGSIERFDPDRGVKFMTYAMRRVRGAILDWKRLQDWNGRENRADGFRREPWADWEGRLVAHAPKSDALEFDDLVRLCAPHDARARGLIRLRYAEGWTGTEIARRLGISEARVWQIHKKFVLERAR